MENILVPPELKGKNTNLETSIELYTTEEARDTFKRANKRMLNPPLWSKLTGAAGAEFLLMSDKGEEENRLAQEGDYFRVDIPGPGSATGEGFDWVKVELIEENANPENEEESCGLKLRASAAPGKDGGDTAHFFEDTATSSFIIRRRGNKVTCSYHGRNEIPNSSTEKTTDNIRNSVVAMGAMAGLSELQWSGLIKGFLEKEIGG